MPKPCFIYPEQNNIDNTTYLIGKLFSKKVDKRKARETIFCPNKRRNTKNECIQLTCVKKCIQQGQTVHRSEVIDKKNQEENRKKQTIKYVGSKTNKNADKKYQTRKREELHTLF